MGTRKVDLNKVPFGNDTESWVLRNDGGIYHNSALKFKTNNTIDEGDILVSLLILYNCYLLLNEQNFKKGVTYDHECLNFYLNGDDLETAITGIRGSVFPAFFGKFS